MATVDTKRNEKNIECFTLLDIVCSECQDSGNNREIDDIKAEALEMMNKSQKL